MYRMLFVEAKPLTPPKASWWRRMVFVMRGGQTRLVLRTHCQFLLRGMPNAHERWKARQTAIAKHAGHETAYLHAVWYNAVVFPENLAAWRASVQDEPKPVPLPLPNESERM